MSWFDKKSIFEIALEGEAEKRALYLIKFVRKVAAVGGGAVPIQRILEIIGFDHDVSKRLQKQRGDVQMKCPKGKLAGTFANKGKQMRESIPNVPYVKPDIVAAPLVRGQFVASDKALELTHIEGLKVMKTVGDELFDMTYRVELIILKPKSIAVF